MTRDITEGRLLSPDVFRRPAIGGSYVLSTGGAAEVALTGMFRAVEAKGWKRRAWPLVVPGTNAIAVFVASGLVAKIPGLVSLDGAGRSLKGWIYDELFADWAGPLNGSLAFAIAYLPFWFAAMWTLYRKRIFLKV
jgi:predicted acyltransferase